MDNKPSQEENSSELSTDNETETGDQGHGKPTENDNPKTESDLEREKRERRKKKRERRDKRRKEYEKHKQHRKNKRKYSSTKEMINDPNYSPLDSEYDDYREALLKEQEAINDMKLETEKLRRQLMGLHSRIFLVNLPSQIQHFISNLWEHKVDKILHHGEITNQQDLV